MRKRNWKEFLKVGQMRERILALIEQMEKEEDEAILVDMEEVDSDEEGDLVPGEWSQTGLREDSVLDTRGSEITVKMW
jgi:hypothetical protein